MGKTEWLLGRLGQATDKAGYWWMLCTVPPKHYYMVLGGGYPHYYDLFGATWYYSLGLPHVIIPLWLPMCYYDLRDYPHIITRLELPMCYYLFGANPHYYDLFEVTMWPISVESQANAICYYDHLETITNSASVEGQANSMSYCRLLWGTPTNVPSNIFPVCAANTVALELDGEMKD